VSNGSTNRVFSVFYPGKLPPKVNADGDGERRELVALAIVSPLPGGHEHFATKVPDASASREGTKAVSHRVPDGQGSNESSWDV